MKTAVFAASLFCFVLYLMHERKRRRGAATIGKCPGAATAAAYEAQRERKRKEETYNFYRDRVETLTVMLEEATREEETAKANLEHLRQLNQYGSVAAPKAEERAARLLYTAQRRRLALSAQLETARKGKQKAIEQLTGV